MEMPDATKVSEIFTYRKNEIKVDCKFQTLLEVFLDQVMAKTKELEEKGAQAERELKLSQISSGDQLSKSTTQDTVQQQHRTLTAIDPANVPLLEPKSPDLLLKDPRLSSNLASISSLTQSGSDLEQGNNNQNGANKRTISKSLNHNQSNAIE